MEQKEEDDLFVSLPEDIVIDIASRLSTKDASRSKCLSKSWHSLISFNSEFKKLHRQRAVQRPRILLVFTNGVPIKPAVFNELRKLDCDFQHIFVNSGLHDIGSCRDLICFHDLRNIYVCSPSTNQYLVLDGNFDHSRHRPDKIGVVYIDSLNAYKIIKMSIKHSNEDTKLKIEAVTLQEDQAGHLGIIIRGGEEEEDNNQQQIINSSWELISKLTLQHSLYCRNLGSPFGVGLGNLIGVNAVVYSIVSFLDKPRSNRRVMFLDFEDDHDKQQQFKTFGLPRVCDDHPNNFWTCTLSQVKRFLCFPYLSNDSSKFDLWLLQDRNTSTWFKGYTIVSRFPGDVPREVVYFPPPAKEIYDNGNCNLNNGDSGQFLFCCCTGKIFGYDIRSKHHEKLLEGSKVHLVPDNLVFLKNGTRYTRSRNSRHSQELIRVDQGPKPTPTVAPPPQQHPYNTYYSSELIKGRIPHPPQQPLPPPPPQLSQPCYPSNSHYNRNLPQLIKVRTPLPPPPQECLPLPPPSEHYSQHNFYTPVLPQVRPPQDPLPLPPLPPQPPPPGYLPHMHHNIYSPRLSRITPHPSPSQCSPSKLQHEFPSPEVNLVMPHSALHQHIQPPPPYYPHNFQQNIFATELKRTLEHPPLPEGTPPKELPYYHHHPQNDIYSPEIKRRRLHPLSPLCAVPLPPESHYPCTIQNDLNSSNLKGRKPVLSLSQGSMPTTSIQSPKLP